MIIDDYLLIKNIFPNSSKKDISFHVILYEWFSKNDELEQNNGLGIKSYFEQ